ncbi:MAG: hypothetical protein JWN25_1603 [Verrucomicrobiales bacterium]|nr:hypothetical protein [Verrucomicrobiales bacterium]
MKYFKLAILIRIVLDVDLTKVLGFLRETSLKIMMDPHLFRIVFRQLARNHLAFLCCFQTTRLNSRIEALHD